MYGRREQVEAQSFVVDRLIAAVLRVDPDASNRPLRRTTVGLFGGVGIAVLVVGIVVLVTLFGGKGPDTWRKPGTLVVDEDSGNRYLLVDGRLRPVLNYASARLLVGGEPPVAGVSADDLAGVPQGGPIGIDGAPDTLPPAGAGSQPWMVCAATSGDDPRVALTVGALAGVTETTEGQALLVRVGRETFLVWQGVRLRVTAEWAPRALGMDPAAALPVDSAWLNTLPSGPDLGAPPVARGGAGPTVAGQPTTLGQLVSAPDAVGDKEFVVTEDGLLPVSATVAALLAADPAEQTPASVTISPARLAAERVLPAPVWQAELPPRPPTTVDTESSVPCVRWSAGETELVSVKHLDGSTADAETVGMSRDGRVADLVDVTPGSGLIARTRPAPGVPGAGVYLVTEAGAKFPVADDEAAQALGFSIDAAELVPAELLALLPTGPVLDIPE
jgi:type VII secretion protein EccB